MRLLKYVLRVFCEGLFLVSALALLSGNWNKPESSNFTTGAHVEEQSFTWTIENFPLVRMHKSLIDVQKIDFTLGEGAGHPTKWTGRLVEEPMKDGKRWIGIYLQPENGELFKNVLMVKFDNWAIKDKTGRMVKKDFGVMHLDSSPSELKQVGYAEFIDADNDTFGHPESITIQITFKLYMISPPRPPKSPSSLKAIMDKFRVKFAEQLQKDLAKNPAPGPDVEILSSDEKDFYMPRGILAARSEVFAAMLRSDMIESTSGFSGLIQLLDISSKALEVLLNFLKTGELLSEWSQTEILVELTNAAGKYQLQDLLQFLDEAMGKVCHLENVRKLLTLARKWSLKVAEDELMQFVRKEGVGSLDDFNRMWPGFQLGASCDQ